MSGFAKWELRGPARTLRNQHSEGLAHVFVNGNARVQEGVIVDALPGRVLTR